MNGHSRRGQPEPAAEPKAPAGEVLRGWLRRIKHSTWARRIAFALLQRFPQLHGPLRRLSEGAAPTRTVTAAELAPDWSGPLPADYVNLSEPAREALLDLARAGETGAALPAAAPAARPALAWIAPLPLAQDTAALLAALAPRYDIHLVAPAAAGDAPFPLHTPDWFEQHASRCERIVYDFANTAAHGFMAGLLARHPGIVVLRDFFLGEAIGAAAPQALRKAVFHSHGYRALTRCDALGAPEAMRAYPANRAVLERAAGVIVHTPAMADLAAHWYGPGSAGHWRLLPAPDAAAAVKYAEAIETAAQTGPGARYRALLRGLGVPADPRRPELLAAAQAIAADLPPTRPRQLLVDVSAMAQVDLKTGISRVVRSILLSLLETPPPGYRVEPVYADGSERRYRYARDFTFTLAGIANPGLDDAPIAHQPGDVFLGLDLTPNSTAQNEALLADMRERGVALFFVVYDMLPLLQEDAFAYGSSAYIRRYIETIARQADGLVCISRAVADEVADWLAAHPAPRATPLRLDYFHLGADLAASVPSTGLAPNAQQVLSSAAQRPTLLMVGTVEPRKGHEQALAACELLWSQNVALNLVIVGKPGWLVEKLIRKLEKHPRLDEQLFWLPSASDEMLTRLYESSSALLAASKGEGFGLPLIEAARHGLPIIARNLPVFREVAGEHAFFFEGDDAQALAQAIQSWLALAAAGKAPPSAGMPWLSWAQSAEQLLAVILGEKRYRTLDVGSGQRLT
ncbi:MAG: glycosyltransferase [Pseudomonadota bacterium]